MVSFFRFFIYSNLFIAACAVLMVNQTYDLLLHSSNDKYYLGFSFSATICSYSFHWYLTSQSLIESPRIEWLKRRRVFHLILFFRRVSRFFSFLFLSFTTLALAFTVCYYYFPVFSSENSASLVQGT